jgi:dipeptidase E
MSRLLLLSNSTNFGEPYLQHAKPLIHAFLGPEVRKVVFIPFAGVTVTWDTYTQNVREHFDEIGYPLFSVHESDAPISALHEADAIVVGGGNTFRLVERLHATGLMQVIRERVSVGISYIGWSAGSNIASPTMRTTNDMPIIEPRSMDTLGLIPFQINPHYTEETLPNHQGETRADRLREFVAINPEMPVVGLPEGTALEVQGENLFLLGTKPAKLFAFGQPDRILDNETDLSFLMNVNDHGF